MNDNFIPNKEEMYPIKPFKLWAMQNFPFIADDFDQMTYYELLCKIVEYLNKVIGNENAIINNENNLYNAFIQLQNFVNDYFDNLDLQEAIDNKLDEMVEDGTLAEIINQEVFSNKLDYYNISTDMNEDDIIDIIENTDGRAKIISFETGTYTFTKRIHLKSNCKFLLNGSTFIPNLNDNDDLIFLGYTADSTATAYNGEHNISFENGFMQVSFAFMHNVNLLFDNIIFSNNVGHTFQIGGCKNVKICNCTFNGSLISENGNNHESIQLEPCSYLAQPYITDPSSPAYDYYGNYNIEICENIFNSGNNLTTINYVAIGNHSNNENNRLSTDLLKIHHNTFNNSHYGDISGGGFNHFEIYNNIFNQPIEITGQATIRLRYVSKNGKIYNNIFNEGLRGIINVNQIENNLNENIEIFSNTFNLPSQTNTQGITLQGVKNSQIHDNFIKANKYLIYLAEPSNTTFENCEIYNNKVDMTAIGETGYGIYFSSGSKLFVSNNFVLQNSSRKFFYNNNGTDYKLVNNSIFNSNGSPASVDLHNINYSNIYNASIDLYSGTTTYSAISSQSVSVPFNNFNTLILVLHKSGNAGKMTTAILHPYGIKEKFDAHTHNISVNIDGTASNSIFKINSDGTFDYTSSNEDVVLRHTYALNELIN